MDLLDRTTPSIFLQELSEVCQHLAVPNLRYIVLKDEGLKQQIQQIDLLRLHHNVGTWTIYEVVPESEHTNTVCH